MGDEDTVTPSNSYRAKGQKSEPLVRLMIFFSHVHAAQKVLQVYLGQKGPTKTPTFRCFRHQTPSWGGGQSGITTCRPSSPPEIRPFGSVSSGFCRQYSREKPCSAIKTDMSPKSSRQTGTFWVETPTKSGQSLYIIKYTEYMIIVYT